MFQSGRDPRFAAQKRLYFGNRHAMFLAFAAIAVVTVETFGRDVHAVI
jgi:hypothetical protein